LQNIRQNYEITIKDRYLIDYSNLSDGFFNNISNSFSTELDYLTYTENPSLGVPFLLPNNLDTFSYHDDSFFTVSKKNIAQNIFSTKNHNYIGVKLYTDNGVNFNSYGTPKEEYLPFVDWVSEINNQCKEEVNKLKRKGKTVCSFQTRNIPHYGHERIIQEGLKKCDFVFINPIIGLKKEGDFKSEIVDKAFSFLINTFYDERVKYYPVIANMFYAGPREACHHSALRKNLGFTHFIVGRDHAGAEGIYNGNDAIKLVSSKNFGINIIAIQGAFFSKKTNNAIIKGIDQDVGDDLIEISGSDFRNCLIKDELYDFCRPELQKYIKSLGGDIFE
jgi:sulfate adenylyltransferase